MGRELKRKEAKKNGKNLKEVQKKYDEKVSTVKNFNIIMIVIVALFSLTYLLTGIFITKDIKLFEKNDIDSNDTNNSINNKILASDSLKQLEEEYYVYYYDSTKEGSTTTDIVDSLSGIVYRVDLHDAFNTNFVGEPSGIVSSIENLKVSAPTVIKVSSGAIIAFYNGSEEIKELR